jgi:hypothetical protein
MYLYLIIIIILIYLLFFIKICEKFKLSEKFGNSPQDYIENIKLIQKKNFGNYNIINNTIDINNNIVNINNEISFDKSLELSNSDIRQNLIGSTLYTVTTSVPSINYTSLRANGAYKIDLQMGYYNFVSYKRYTHIIVVNPGFGIFVGAYNDSTNATTSSISSYINIENYGNKPLRYNIYNSELCVSSQKAQNTPNNVNISTTQDLYNNDSSTYKIFVSGNFANDIINIVNVYLISLEKWKDKVKK